ncbi:MAG: SPOR domain-containing protein [Candidatus Omnitrophota bacterium]
MNEKQLYLFNSILPNAQKAKRFTLILPMDILILISVILIVLFAVVFSLGIEKGKANTYRNIAQNNLIIADESKQPPAIEVDKIVVCKEEEEKDIKPQPVKEEIYEQNSSSKSFDKYFIQVATYRMEKTALREKDLLTEGGFPVVVSKSKKFAIVFVGGFNDKNTAKQALPKLKKRYKDCFIKRVEGNII